MNGVAERRGRFSPLLAIKLPKAHHNFRLSSVPAQNSDLRATLCGNVLRCDRDIQGEDVFRLEEGVSRERRDCRRTTARGTSEELC